MTKSREKCYDKHNYIENSCLFVVIPSVQSVQSVAKYYQPFILFYAKQTQFTKYPNERKCCYNKEIRRKSAAQPSQKQTQYKPNSNPNKPNWLEAQNERKQCIDKGM